MENKSYDPYLGCNRVKPAALPLQDRTEYFDIFKRVVSHSMSESQKNIPLAGLNYEPDITAFWVQYQILRREKDITFNTLMLKVVAECLTAAPILNAHITYHARSSCGKLHYKEQINITMPTALQDGSLLPLIVRDVGQKTLHELSKTVNELKHRLDNTIAEHALFDLSAQRMLRFLKKGHWLSAAAKALTGLVGVYKIKLPPSRVLQEYQNNISPEDRLSAADIGEGSLSVTNWGSLYRDFRGNCTVASLVPPTVFCNAIGPVQERPLFFKKEDGSLEISTQKILPLCLLFDHRIGGFGTLVPYIRKMDEIFANPTVIHQW